jgi:hypothetical protein
MSGAIRAHINQPRMDSIHLRRHMRSIRPLADAMMRGWCNQARRHTLEIQDTGSGAYIVVGGASEGVSAPHYRASASSVSRVSTHGVAQPAGVQCWVQHQLRKHCKHASEHMPFGIPPSWVTHV